MNVVELTAEKLTKYLQFETNILKVVEECAELQEVMVKYLTKNETLKPKKEKLVEEMGDVIFRIAVASHLLGVEDDVAARVDEKARHMLDWVTNKFENKHG